MSDIETKVVHTGLLEEDVSIPFPGARMILPKGSALQILSHVERSEPAGIVQPPDVLLSYRVEIVAKTAIFVSRGDG